MVKKISIFTLLFSLFLAVFVPVTVKANEDIKRYEDVNDFLCSMGLNLPSIDIKDNYSYIVVRRATTQYIDVICIPDNVYPYRDGNDIKSPQSITYEFYFINQILPDYSNCVWGCDVYNNQSQLCSFYEILYSDVCIYSDKYYSSVQFYPNKLLDEIPSIPNDFKTEYETVVCGRYSVMNKANAYRPFLIVGSGFPLLKLYDLSLTFVTDNGGYTSDIELWLVNDSGEWYLAQQGLTTFGATDIVDYNAYWAPEITYTNKDIYIQESKTDNLMPDGEPWKSYIDFIEPYTFEDWCSDAGLNCKPSSNESSTVIPFWYNENYNYIVRKIITPSNTSGIWQLTMIQNGSDFNHYPYHFVNGDVGYIGVAGVHNSTFTVRDFYYDTDGWKLIDRHDVSSLPFANNQTILSDNVVMIYSNTDIYSDADGTSIWYPASLEFYDVPDSTTPIPTTVPGSSGSGRPGSGTRPDTGGQATGGGGLDFIINLFTKIWTDICSVKMSVDGYSISLQQIFVYGALVSIVGGFIMHFIFGRK